MSGPQGDEATASIYVQDRGSKSQERSSNSHVVHNLIELDGIHDGLTFPTEEEKKNLCRIPDSIPLNVYREPTAMNLARIANAFASSLSPLSCSSCTGFLANRHKRPKGGYHVILTFR